MEKPQTMRHLPHRAARYLPAALLVVGLGALAGCGSDEPPPSFAPLHYDYLSRFQLNVASLQVVDNAPPGSVPGDISGAAPTPPDQALQRMANDRLAAAGTAGTAIFSIDRASILHAPGGTLEGEMDVHLDIVLPSGQHAGLAEAKVTRSYKPDDSSGNADSPTALYTITSQMMNDMNVELEMQIRGSLKDWLVDAGGAPIAGAIQQQSLDAPGAEGSVPPPATPATPAATANPATPGIPAVPAASAPAAPPAAAPPPAAPAVPDAIFPTGGGDAAEPAPAVPAAPQPKSPQPGFLHLPSGAAGSTGAAPTGN